MPKCQFTTKYYDHEKLKRVDFCCDDKEPLASGFCIFHDKDYLQDKTNNEEHKRKVLDRLKNKINHAISNNETLLCIGFQLPEFSLSDLSNSKEFTKLVYFNGSQFLGKAIFTEANFKRGAIFVEANFEGVGFARAKFGGEAYFGGTNFQGEAYFSSEFNSKTNFDFVLFEGKEKVIFDIENLSNVSFMNTDVTGVRFSDKARWGEKKVEYDKFWGGKKVKEDKFKIVDERLLEDEINKENDGHTTKDFNIGSIKAVYRSLRENYEYRMRYDEAGQFFIREMELKRKYRECPSKEEENGPGIKQNNWFRRNFSLTGLYYNLFVYGEDLKRPALILLLPLFILSTLYSGAIDPSSSSINDGFARWFTATERTLFNMAQIERKDPPPELVDTAIKTASLAILGTLLIPLRRRFERKFRH